MMPAFAVRDIVAESSRHSRCSNLGAGSSLPLRTGRTGDRICPHSRFRLEPLQEPDDAPEGGGAHSGRHHSWPRDEGSDCKAKLLTLHAGSTSRRLRNLTTILLVADLFEPVDGFAVERFLNSNMCHGGGRSCAMPVLLAWRKPDYVAGVDLLNRTALALRPTATGDDDQVLP